LVSGAARLAAVVGILLCNGIVEGIVGRPPSGKTWMTNAERQRRWRERRNALASEAEIARLPKPGRRRKAKLVGDHRDQTNAFIREALEFNFGYCHRLEAWLAIARLDDEDRGHLGGELHKCANELSRWAQKVMGY
jgi:hypothetical protein